MQRLIVVGLMSLGFAFGMTACGSHKSGAPTITRSSDGQAFIARVENKSEAKKACTTMQRELGAQLKKLGVGAGDAEVVEFHYGQGNPAAPTGSTYVFHAGEFVVVSKNVAGCGVVVS